MKALEITTMAACPVNCGFCPQSKLKAAYAGEKILTPDNFKNCISTVPLDVRIDWSGFVEPLINPHTAELMEIAYKLGFWQVLYTTLVGINPAKAEAIKKFVGGGIRVHVPDTNAMIYPAEKWLEHHRTFMDAGLSGSYMTMGNVEKMISDQLVIGRVTIETPVMLSRGGLVDVQDKKTRLDGEIRCAANRWHQNVMLPNGDVVACCMDYGMTMPLGNLLRQDYREIEAAANALEANSNPPASSICRSCEWASQK